jgi:hypothetical protein
VWKFQSPELRTDVAFLTHWTGIQGLTKCEVIDNYYKLPLLHVLGEELKLQAGGDV